MNTKKGEALEAAGWRFGDAADFLGMTDEERQLLDARVEAALAVRRQRMIVNLSQKQLASRIDTTQPRVAKIERAARDVSLDQILRAFAAAGGRIIITQAGQPAAIKTARKSAEVERKKTKNGRQSTPAKLHIELIGTE